MDKKSIIGLIIEAIFFIAIISIVWKCLDRKVDISEQNLIAAKSELNKMELENGELLYERDSYILKEKELEDELNISKKEIKEMKKKLDSSLAYIATLESQVKMDTIVTIRDSIVYKNIDYIYSQFSHKDEWVDINGENHIYLKNNNVSEIETNLISLNIRTPLIIGLTDDYQFFVKTENPFVTFTNIEGAAIENSKIVPKKKRFNAGIQLGIGMNYGIIKKDIDFGPYLGVGCEWNF